MVVVSASREGTARIALDLGTGSLECTGSLDGRGRPDGLELLA